MSIGSLSTIGVARDQRKPTQKDAGKDLAEAPDEEAKLRDMLVSAIPTELIAPYTFLVTAIVGLIDPETHAHFPDQFQALRWILFGLLCVGTVYFVQHSYDKKKKSEKSRGFPTLEVATGLVAAVVWGLSLPESPLVPQLNGDSRTLVPLIILVVGTIVFGALANQLKDQAT